MKQLFIYGIVGVMTTLLNIFSYWLITRIFAVGVVYATITAWFIAVLFAYWANRKYVFHSRVKSFLGVLFEACYFFMCRIATGIIDVVIMYLFVDVFAFNDVIIKTASNILVIILNYIASKVFVFRGDEKGDKS